MGFTWDYHMNDFLFENFNIDSLKKCLLTVFIVFCLAYLSHVIKMVQVLVEHYFGAKWMAPTTVDINTEVDERAPLVQSLRIPTSNSYLKMQKFKKHCVQSLLYTLNLIIAYLLMLIVMNYYAGHFIAMVLGLTFGYYILNVSTPNEFGMSRKPGQTQTLNGEHSIRNGAGNITYDEI